MKNLDITEFKDFLVKEPNDSLREFEQKERDTGFPIIKRGVQDLLRVLMNTANPKTILELGCGVGFSSVFMAFHSKNIEKITTIELKEDNIKRAEKNIKSFKFEDKIEILKGDAVKILENKTFDDDSFDFVFIDCAKAQYNNLWNNVRTLVKPGGIILTDDVLQNLTVTKSRFLLNRRDRTIHKRMRDYLYQQMNDEEFTGGLFEIDDGVTILTRNKDV